VKKYIVDRIEGDYVVCIDEQEKILEVKLSKFSFPIKEGLFLLYNNDEERFYPDIEKMDKLKVENCNRLNRLFNRKQK